MPLKPEALAILHAQCFPRGWSAAEFADLLVQPGVFCVEEGKGFLFCRVAADEAEILTFAVAPAAQGCGMGGRLLRQAMEKACAMGATAMFLEVAEGNAPALALYRKAGFMEAARRKGYYALQTQDALVMRKELR